MQVANAIRSPFVKLPHYLWVVRIWESLYALPFCYMGMMLASVDSGGNGWPGWSTFIWITVALTGVRTLGMSANRFHPSEGGCPQPSHAGTSSAAGSGHTAGRRRAGGSGDRRFLLRRLAAEHTDTDPRASGRSVCRLLFVHQVHHMGLPCLPGICTGHVSVGCLDRGYGAVRP